MITKHRMLVDQQIYDVAERLIIDSDLTINKVEEQRRIDSLAEALQVAFENETTDHEKTEGKA